MVKGNFDILCRDLMMGPRRRQKIGTFKFKFLVYLMNKSARVWRNVYNFTNKSFYFTVHTILGTFWKIKFLKSAINTLFLRSEMFFCLKLLPYLHYWANWLMRSTKKFNLKIHIFSASYRGQWRKAWVMETILEFQIQLFCT